MDEVRIHKPLGWNAGRGLAGCFFRKEHSFLCRHVLLFVSRFIISFNSSSKCLLVFPFWIWLCPSVLSNDMKVQYRGSRLIIRYCGLYPLVNKRTINSSCSSANSLSRVSDLCSDAFCQGNALTPHLFTLN